MKTLILIASLVSIQANAEWLCETQSSIMYGNDTILTCGKATAQNETEARKLARENALEEFQSLVKSSVNADRDYLIEPKRTECKIDHGSITCVRALQFHLGQIKAKKKFDREALESELKERQNELDDLSAKLHQLDTLDRKIAEAKIEKKEVKAMEIESKLKDEKYAWQYPEKTHTLRIGLSTHSYDVSGAYFGWEYKVNSFIGLDLSGESLGGSDNLKGFGARAAVRLYGYKGLNLIAGYQSLKLSQETTELGCAAPCATYETEVKTTDLSGSIAGLGWSSKSTKTGLMWELEATYEMPQDKSLESGVNVRLGFGFGF